MSEHIHFDDLTDYTHQISPFTLNAVKNIGWLNFASGFSTKRMSELFLNKLKLIASGAGAFRPLVEPVRELPVCQLCGEVELVDLAGNLLPNAELWIPANGVIYASPIAILHFIEKHNYSPPAEYIDAINLLDISIPFVADEVYREKLKESGWFNRAR